MQGRTLAHLQTKRDAYISSRRSLLNNEEVFCLNDTVLRASTFCLAFLNLPHLG